MWSKLESQSTNVNTSTTPHHRRFTGLFPDHPGEPVPEENVWILWCKGRLTEADTLTIWLGAIPSRQTSAHLHHAPYFLRAGCPSCRPTNSVKSLKAKIFHVSEDIIKNWYITFRYDS